MVKGLSQNKFQAIQSFFEIKEKITLPKSF